MSKAQQFHEEFDARDQINAGSERSFGIVFAVVFAIVGLFPLWNSEDVRVWALVVAGLFLVLGFAVPAALRPLNLLWFRFGLLLHKIVNPLIMALLFYVTVTPIALIMRMLGKDPLNRQFDPSVSSYWIKRDPDELQPETMRRQF